MKKYFFIIIIIITLASVLSGCTQEPQTKLENVKIAVVDQSQLWSQSEQAQDYQQQLDEKVEELKAEYEVDLEALSTQEKAAKHQEIYQQINDFRQQLKEKFREDIAKTVKTIAEEQGYDVVLNKDEVRYGGEDITAEVLKEL
ncbi:MAG: OmpH family outer membrane protein [Bacillota bacterium]